MIEADALTAWLATGPGRDGAYVAGWRVEMVRSAGLRAGVRDSRLGGPYEAPGLARTLGGSLDLHWSDGRLTRTRLDRRAIEGPDAMLAGWLAAASEEKRRPPLAEQTPVPAVQVRDPDLALDVTERPDRLLDLLQRAQQAQRAAGARRLDAVLRAGASERSVVTSAGFRYGWEETALSLQIWVDEAGEASFGRRRLPTDAELAAVFADGLDLGRRLGQGTPLPHDARGVLFMPAAVEALLGRFVLPNLLGSSIVEGRSAFSRDDLDTQRQVLRPDLDVLVDTTLPFALATAPCSSDGVPARRAVLIESGRLVAPILDVATAREVGRTPTPSPRGRPTLILAAQSTRLDPASALTELGAGIVVRELQGLHTQSRHRWTFALAVPDAQAVVAGSAAGRSPARISGNLLDILQAPSTRLVAVPGEVNPALLAIDSIRIDAA